MATRGVAATVFLAGFGMLALGGCQPDNAPDPASPSSQAPSATPSSTCPNDYEGTWVGRVIDAGNGRSWKAEVHLYPLLGTGLVTYTFSDNSECFGSMKLVQDLTGQVVLSEASTYQATKCGNGYETLALVGGSLHYEFRKAVLTKAKPDATGTLTKST
jgi:hypothetical protein